jgi:hypothetical protein
VINETTLLRGDTTQMSFTGAGVTATGTGANAVQVFIPQTVDYAGTNVTRTDLVGTTFLAAGLAPQGSAYIDTAAFYSIGFTAPTAGVYTVGYVFAISAQGTTGSNGVEAYTNIMFSIDGGIKYYLPGARFVHPDNPTTVSPIVLNDVNLDAFRIYLGAGAHTIALFCRTVSAKATTTHTFNTATSRLLVTRINPQVV